MHTFIYRTDILKIHFQICHDILKYDHPINTKHDFLNYSLWMCVAFCVFLKRTAFSLKYCSVISRKWSYFDKRKQNSYFLHLLKTNSRYFTDFELELRNNDLVPNLSRSDCNAWPSLAILVSQYTEWYPWG